MKTITKHEEQYWHIPKFKIGLLALLILTLLLTFGYSFIFINEWNLHDINFILNCQGEECRDVELNSLGFIPHLFFAYLLISLNFIILVSIIKGGFNKLKKERGLVFGLMWGLIGGSICSLVGFLIGALVLQFIYGMISGMVMGMISSTISGIIWGFIIGLMWGLDEEFVWQLKYYRGY